LVVEAGRKAGVSSMLNLIHIKACGGAACDLSLEAKEKPIRSGEKRTGWWTRKEDASG